MAKLRALRNFSGQKGMILRGEVIEVSEPFITDYTFAGLCEWYSDRPIAKIPEDYKTMKTKRNVKT